MADQPIILAAGPVELLTAADGTKTPRVEILAYSGGKMSVPGWGPIVLDLQGLDISPPTPILADHRNELSGIVGSGVAEIRQGKLFVSGPIVAATEAGKQVLDLGKAGFPFQASVGIEPIEREYVQAGTAKTVNGQTIASDVGYSLIRRGKLREISITALGSDASTSVRVAASQRKETTMETNTQTPEQIIRAERDRVASIEAACSGLTFISGDGLHHRVAELRAKAISGELKHKGDRRIYWDRCTR